MALVHCHRVLGERPGFGKGLVRTKENIWQMVEDCPLNRDLLSGVSRRGLCYVAKGLAQDRFSLGQLALRPECTRQVVPRSRHQGIRVTVARFSNIKRLP